MKNSILKKYTYASNAKVVALSHVATPFWRSKAKFEPVPNNALYI